MEKSEFVDLLNLNLKIYSERIATQYNDVKEKLDLINKHLDKQNSRIFKTEEKINQVLMNDIENKRDHEKMDDRHTMRDITCPVKNEINECLNIIRVDLKQLKDDSLTKRQVKNYLIVGLGVISTILTIINLLTNMIL